MNKDLPSYIKIYSNIFDIKKLNKLVYDLEKYEQWERHYFYNPIEDRKIDYGAEPDVCFFQSEEQKDLQTEIWHYIYKYVFHDIGANNWFEGWSGYSQLRFNKYSINEDMKIHCDHVQTLFDGKRRGVPILSIVGLLNDNFEGGHFLMFDNFKINLKSNDLLIFPSNFLYPHKITAVTSGVRYSYVSWVW